MTLYAKADSLSTQMRTETGARLFAMADKGGSLMSRRYRRLAEQLARDEGGVRKAARRLGVAASTFSEHMHDLKNAKPTDIENAVKKLRVDWRFFTDASLGESPDYRRFVHSEKIVRDDVPASFVAWEADLAPRSYDPGVHRARMLASGFRFPPTQAAQWTRLFELILDEARGLGQTEAGRAETAAAKAEGDALGMVDLPAKPPRKVRR